MNNWAEILTVQSLYNTPPYNKDLEMLWLPFFYHDFTKELVENNHKMVIFLYKLSLSYKISF